MTSHQLARAINTEILSDALGIPKLMIDYPLIENPDITSWSNFISNKLALQSLCTLALPRLYSANVEDIVYLRKALKDELTEFKSGILQLTYLIYKYKYARRTGCIKQNKYANQYKIEIRLLDMENRNKNLSSKLIVEVPGFYYTVFLQRKAFQV